jgi:hypothetical protein
MSATIQDVIYARTEMEKNIASAVTEAVNVFIGKTGLRASNVSIYVSIDKVKGVSKEGFVVDVEASVSLSL